MHTVMRSIAMAASLAVTVDPQSALARGSTDFALVTQSKDQGTFIEKHDIRKDGKTAFLVFIYGIFAKDHKAYAVYPDLAFTRTLLSIDCSVGFIRNVGDTFAFDGKGNLLDRKSFHQNYEKPPVYTISSDIVSYVCPALAIPANRLPQHIVNHSIEEISVTIRTSGNVRSLIDQQPMAK